MNEEFKVLEMVARRLEKGNIPYMITGSVAMNYYTTPRMTRDVDFIIRKSDPYRQLEFDRRRKVEVAGIPLWIVSAEDLILSKLFWAKESLSDFQLRDVRNLRFTAKFHHERHGSKN